MAIENMETVDMDSFDDEAAQSFQTSEEEIVETQEVTSTDESEETESGEGTATKDEVDYKIKFSESSREALRLLDEKKALQAERDKERAERERLAKDLEDARNLLRETNPDAYNFKNLEGAVSKMSEKIALSEENESLNSYIKSNPEAEASKEALRQLGRANPSLSYGDIWNTHFKPIVEKISTSKVANIQKKKASMPETGKGNSASDLSVDISSTNFSKLSLEQRREHFKKLGL